MFTTIASSTKYNIHIVIRSAVLGLRLERNATEGCEIVDLLRDGGHDGGNFRIPSVQLSRVRLRLLCKYRLE